MGKRTRGKEIKGKRTKENPKAKIYIFTEGHTEKIYFGHFEEREYNAQVIASKSKSTAAFSIVEEAKNFIIKGEIDLELGDRVYCAFDSDPKSNPDINKAFDLIEGFSKRGLYCIFSNPSFEVWFILHITDTIPHGLTAKKMKAELKKLLKEDYPNYIETTDIYDWLKDKQDCAYQRAKKLHASQEKVFKRVLSHECNPYSNIFDFIEYMDAMRTRNTKK